MYPLHGAGVNPASGALAAIVAGRDGMRATAFALLLALAASCGCAMRPGGVDQEAPSVPIKVRVRITPYSRVANIADLRNAALKIAHVTAVNVLDFGQVADDQSDGTLPVYELQCCARTSDISLPRIFECLELHGYEVTDLLVQVLNEDDAYTILLRSLTDFGRTRGIALSSEWLPVRAADGLPEVRSLSRMGERCGEMVAVKFATGWPAASDETMFLYAYILDRMGYRKAVAPLRTFLRASLQARAKGGEEAKYRRAVDMTALVLLTLTGHAKIDYVSWQRDKDGHYASILAAADAFVDGTAKPTGTGKPKPTKAPPTLR